MVGLDPVPARLPRELAHLPPAEAVLTFCRGILEAVEPYAAAAKLQAAFFERLGPSGMGVYADLISYAGSLGLPPIADVKRGDIGPVAAAYAEAHLAIYGAACVTPARRATSRRDRAPKPSSAMSASEASSNARRRSPWW